MLVCQDCQKNMLHERCVCCRASAGVPAAGSGTDWNAADVLALLVRRPGPES